jgi:N-formylglutamate amidohydrolase
LGDDVTINKPFAGGFITRSHGREMPWVQIELSRIDDVSVADKRAGVLRALTEWCGLELWK